MNKYSQKLELNQIINQLVELCIINKTKNIASNIKPSNDILEINHSLEEVDEALTICLRYDRAPIMISEEYEHAVKIAKKGGVLSGLELYQTVRLYNTIKANQQFLLNIQKENIKAINYEEKVNSLYINEFLYHNLERSIDESGYVLDDATPSLANIRRRLQLIDVKIKSKLQEMLGKEASKLSQPTISMRDGHYVLPVKVEYKNSFRGNILDVSGSQQTVFIEPIQVIELTIQKAELINLEKAEVEKILKFLSQDIGAEALVLIENFNTIVNIDLTFAKAMLAKKQNAEKPRINNEHHLNLVNARHPLLKVKKVIPNNISFDDYLGIVITGPNTGGKTVLLKTVGLLVLMTKCGLLIPASKESNIMIYDMVCCDIGDEQSITENLSTFSGHMSNIVDIINSITPNSLVLFDEIGGGTDPTEGSNLAISILDYLVSHKVAFITTTHYSKLKTYAYSNPLIVNASMEFDQNTLSPTYRLKLGIPGSSNAFEIASKLGLVKSIIDDAKERTTEEDNDVSVMIKKLEHTSLTLEKKLEEAEKIKEDYLQKQLEYQKKLEKLEFEKQIILKKAQQQADLQLEKIKTDALAVLSEIKEKNNQAIKLHEAIALQKAIEDINIEIVKEKKVEPKKKTRLPLEGDNIYVKDYDQYGHIVKVLKDNMYSVTLGNITMKLGIDDFELVEKEQTLPKEKITTYKIASKGSISMRLDLRGDRYEEAKDKIEKYFDDAMLCGLKQFTIIHGYGTGTIRSLVQSYLKTHKAVESYRYGGAGEGGMGVTVVTLK